MGREMASMSNSSDNYVGHVQSLAHDVLSAQYTMIVVIIKTNFLMHLVC
jgi:hypothetical protein